MSSGLTEAASGHGSAQFGLGLTYAEGMGVAQDVDRAIELYTQAAEQGDAGAYSNLGLLLQNERQDVNGAEKAFRAAIEADPGLVAAHINLGSLLITERNDADGAKKAFRTAIKVDPGCADAHRALGLLLEKLK